MTTEKPATKPSLGRRFARFTAGALVAAGVVAGGTLAAAATGTALPAPAPLDPYTPVPALNWCPGGGSSTAWGGYCDGVSYPDGTRWNVAWANAPFAGSVYQPMNCVVYTGAPMPPLAGPWGCGRSGLIGSVG